MKKYVSIDIGGTEIKYGLIDEKGQILTRSKMKTEAYKEGPSILEKAVRIGYIFYCLFREIRVKIPLICFAITRKYYIFAPLKNAQVVKLVYTLL